MAEHEGPIAETSIDALRQLKQVETETAAKLAQAKADAQEQIQRARDSAESMLAEVRRAVERERESILQSARSDAQADATRIVAEGEQRAASVADGATQGAGRLKAKLLDAVLGEFRPSGVSGK
jgi:vacuolar-type H+-ATPase subunit H